MPALLTALVTVLAACSDRSVEPVPAPPPATDTAVPAYDARAEPAAAVLPLVPESATSLSVTDLERVRLQQEGPSEVVVPTAGLLAPADRRLARDYGFDTDDVLWEARFDGPSGGGWVLSFRLGQDMDAVERAVRDGVGVLEGAEVLADDRLVVLAAAEDGAESWAADPALAALVGTPADATYVERGCVEPPAGVDTSRLDPLEAWSVALHGGLATGRLGEARRDAFARLELTETWPADPQAFSDGFRNGVADPASGRVGFQIVDPRVAAELVRGRTLPFAACAS